MLALTERAKHSLKVAHDFGAAAGAEYVDTGQIFLGVLAEPQGVAARALANLGVLREEVSMRLKELDGVHEERAPGAARLSRPAKMAIECSLQEARVLGCSHADTHHLVLGLLRAAQTYRREACVFESAVGFEDRLRIRNEILQLSPRPPKPR